MYRGGEAEELEQTVDDILLDAVCRGDTAGVQEAIRNGADVNDTFPPPPLITACSQGFPDVVRILLDAGADPRWQNRHGYSTFLSACSAGNVAIVEMLLNHDKGAQEIGDFGSWGTPLLNAIKSRHSLDIVRFLLDQGANVHAVNDRNINGLMLACRDGGLAIVRLLLNAGVDVEARTIDQQTALHFATFAIHPCLEVARELVLRHNANMFAVDQKGATPFDGACKLERAAVVADLLLELYGNKMTEEHGGVTLHAFLTFAEYSFAETEAFHPPLNPLRIILPLGKLTLKHLRTLLSTLDTELIRHRDDNGKLPIHIACQADPPVEILAVLVELDSATLHIADNTGMLPIHLLCCCSGVVVDHASLLYQVEQGGIGTLAARNRQGALPLHILCGSTNPSLRTVQYLIQSFPGSVSAPTPAGQYPFMLAACKPSPASLSVVYELIRVNPDLAVPR